jgi:peroxiredoxin
MTLRNFSIMASIIALTWAVTDAAAATNGQRLAEETGQSLIGTPAPQLVFKTIDGETIDLGRLYGKQAVYLKFWATWCVPCRQQMPHFEHTYEAAGADLAVIAIDAGFNDSIEAVRDYRRKLGLTMPIVFDDGRAGAAFKLRVTPQHIVIGRDGRIRYVGHLADAQLDAALLSARTAAVPVGTADKATAAVPSKRAYKIGDRLPRESPLTIDGRRFSFRDPGDQRHTILVFLSPWCESYLETTRPAISADCRRMREEVSSLAGEHGARWLGIASGLWATPDDLRQYRLKYHVDIPLSLDASGNLFRAFDVTTVPAALVADADGRILRRIGPPDLETSAAFSKAVNSQ